MAEETNWKLFANTYSLLPINKTISLALKDGDTVNLKDIIDDITESVPFLNAIILTEYESNLELDLEYKTFKVIKPSYRFGSQSLAIRLYIPSFELYNSYADGHILNPYDDLRFIGEIKVEYTIEPIHAESISVEPKEFIGEVGDILTLKPTILPLNASEGYFEWYCHNPDVVSIDSHGNGVATLIKEGEAIIVFHYWNRTADGKLISSGMTAECHVTVRAPEVLVSSISLSPSSAEGTEGEQIQINATVLPEDATNKALAWSSSDESVAMVNESGLISLLEKGNAVITASATDNSGVSADCTIVVTEASGIEDILTDKAAYVKIFNLRGVLVYEGIYSEANLAPDYYILICDGKNTKVKIE